MHSERKFCKIQRILLQMDPKAVSIYYDFVLLPHKQKEQNKLIRLNTAIWLSIYLLRNPLGSVESWLSFKNPLANLSVLF